MDSQLHGPALQVPRNLGVLWAKSNPPHALWRHLLDAAAVSMALQNPLEEEGWDATIVALFVGLHDVGKADPHFQVNVLKMGDGLASEGFAQPDLSAKSGEASRHERHSRDYILRWLADLSVDERAAATLAQAVGWHHARWHSDEPAPMACGESGKSGYLAARDALLHLLLAVLGIREVSIPEPRHNAVLGMRLAGHVVLCDWIASNGDLYTPPWDDDPVNYFLSARGVAGGAVRRLDLGVVGTPIDPTELIPNGSNARPLQQAILDDPPQPGIVIIEAPMGEGKTEAAWMVVEQWRASGHVSGAYMALPTMATSEGLFTRYRDDYLGKHSDDGRPRLIHGMAWLRDDGEPGRTTKLTDTERTDDALADSWFRPTRRALLAQHGVGTVDQAMLAAMNAKFSFLRLYGLSNKALIIDEVHAYDAYMSAILERLLSWCSALGIPVILLSATLSAEQRAKMLLAYGAMGGDPGPEAPYPLAVAATLGQPVEIRVFQHDVSREQVIAIERHHGMLEDAQGTARLAEGVVAAGGVCCVILNTVRQAQAVYRELNLKKADKTLFHSRFKFSDREKRTSSVLRRFGKDRSRRPLRHVLVATQVVEQSLDVDFDFMITQVAPMDLLLQRCGRLHRHVRRTASPVLHVLMPDQETPDFAGTGRVYAGKPLLRTVAILDVADVIRLPQDFRLLIERCYGQSEWDQNAVAWSIVRMADEKWCSDNELLEGQARLFAYGEPSKRLFKPVDNIPTGDDNDDGTGWRAKTRHGANDRTAVLVSSEEASRLAPGDLRMREVKRIYRRALKVPSYLPLSGPVAGHSPAREAQGKLRGLTLVPIGEDGSWRGCNDEGIVYELRYDDDLGLLAGRVA